MNIPDVDALVDELFTGIPVERASDSIADVIVELLKETVAVRDQQIAALRSRIERLEAQR